MAGALKHKQRSHRSYHKSNPFLGFERRAAIKSDDKYKKSMAKKILDSIAGLKSKVSKKPIKES